MSNSLRLQLAVSATLALSAISSVNPAIAAATFSQQEVDQSKFIAVAAPYGRQAHQLLILEQVSNKQACWQEGGIATGSHTSVEPLLLGFDFTGICGRSTDSNGYSLRMAGQDLGLKYSLRVVKRNNELVLIGQPNRGQNLPALEIGRTRGLDSGFAKIFLDPGWRLSKRVYNDRPLGHVYLTNDLAPETLLPSNIATGSTSPTTIPAVGSTKPVTLPTTGSTRPSNGPVTVPAPLPAARPTQPIGIVRPTQPIGTVRPAQPTVVIPKTPATATVIPVPVPPPQSISQPVSQPIGQPISQPIGVTSPKPTASTSVPILVPPPETKTGNRPSTSSVKLPTITPAVSIPPVTNSSRPLPTNGIKVTPAPSLPSVIPSPSAPSKGGFVVPTVGEQSSTQAPATPTVQIRLPTVTVYQ
ncbi:DUF3747 domain-containing protein [Trichocoleus desertorum AS-A10]|uniref:DUF3747 domain-containing protein n=1 Tax=Trichocoleus desertorum TaxID=1481672 RepID=UPI003299E87F